MSYNRETLRIVEGIRPPDHPVEQMMDILSIRRIDGREVPLEELPLAQRLSTYTALRAEEVVLRASGGG